MRNYGNGKSTGFDQTALGSITTGFTFDEMYICKQDAEILKVLAQKVAEIASSPKMKVKRELWRKHNRLESVQPLILCDPENGWNEIITENQIECKSDLACHWEMKLRKEIFWGEEMNDDKPVEPYFVVPYTVTPDNWGLKTVFRHSELLNGSKSWDAPLKDYEKDLPKLKIPEIEIDWKTTNRCLEVSQEVFEGILDVQLRGTWWWSLGITLPAVMLRGLANLYMDFIDQPNNLKMLFKFISDGYMKKLDYLEKTNLLSSNNDGTYIGSGGYGFSDELPSKIYNNHVHCKDMWGFAESQETVSVSPDMYGEYVFPFEKPILDRFGLNCYGCCEPIDPRWIYVKQHSNLRRISCSPWADIEKMAKYLGQEYICSYKPSPVLLAHPQINEEAIRSDIRKVLEVFHNSRLEIIMKDNHTLGNNPMNVVKWCAITRDEIERYKGF